MSLERARGMMAGATTAKRRTQLSLWIAALLASCAFVILPFLLRLDGKPHANWEQFLGRFHVLAVHLPIALILLVPLLEIAGSIRPALREAAAVLLWLALASAIGSFALGFLLAWGSGESGVTVTRHLWGAVVVTVGLIFSVLVRPSWSLGEDSRWYPALLALVVLALVWTAHQGGSLTHGADYLTEYMPASLSRWLGSGGLHDAVVQDSFYAMHVHPIFDSRCVGCHGASKTEAGLRLDSYTLLMHGGQDGPVIVRGKPDQSLLIKRVTLQPGDKHFMPAEGRPPLSPQQIAWIKAWIQQGASPTATTIAGISIPSAPVDSPPQPVGDYSALLPEIHAMQQGQGAKLAPVSSNPSDGLILSTVDVASSFDDGQLARFEKYAPYIVEADLGRTAITDASFATLATFTHLRALHLEGTSVKGEGLARLAALTQLNYLNLSGTKVTSTAAAPLASMKNLHHIYLFNTPAEPAPADAKTETPARSTP